MAFLFYNENTHQAIVHMLIYKFDHMRASQGEEQMIKRRFCIAFSGNNLMRNKFVYGKCMDSYELARVTSSFIFM